MRDFETYSPEGVIFENLGELTERLDILEEQEMAHLRELAIEVAQSDDLSDLLSSLHYYRISPSVAPTTNLLPNAELLLHSRRLLGARQCMFFCQALYEELRSRDSLLPSFFPDADEVVQHAAARIVYQRSSYTDDAYLAFASLIPGARAAYAHSFPVACEDVYNGHCEYCILPLENAVEGELIGFAKLIAQYDLKIAACCDIVGADTARRTRFALLRRNILPLLHKSIEENRFFRFSIPSELSASMADILSAANFFGLSFLSANTLPIDKEETKTHFNLTFSIGDGSLYPFLLYLATVAPQYTPIGIYTHLKQKG